MSLVSVLIILFFFKIQPVEAVDSCIDDFESNRTCNWEEIKDQRSSWNMVDGRLIGQAMYFLSEGSIYYLAKNELGNNYSVEADVTTAEGVDKTIIGRFQNPKNYYVLNLRSSFNGILGNDFSLSKHCCNGLRKILARIPLINKADQTYRLKLEFNGPEINAFVDGKQLIRYKDTLNAEPAILTGYPGIGVWGGNWNLQSSVKYTRVAFDNVSIKPVIKKRVFILIPGFGGSLNLASLFSCSLDDKSSPWTLAPYAKVYDRLINTFVENGYRENDALWIYAYDWRQQMDIQADLLKYYIDTKINDHEAELNFIAHSLGGLVARSFIDKYGQDYALNKTITIGTPNSGTFTAYQIWEGGVTGYNDRVIKLAIDTLLNYCSAKLNKDLVPLIHTLVPSIKDIIPVYPFLIDENNNYKDPKDMTEFNSWLSDLNMQNRGPVTSVISGNNNATIEAADVVKSNSPVLWRDGEPVNLHKTGGGDGTVLLKSALLPDADTVILDNHNHSQIINSKEALDTIFSKLLLQNFKLSEEKNDNQLRINSIPKTLDKLLNIPLVWKRYKLKSKEERR